MQTSTSKRSACIAAGTGLLGEGQTCSTDYTTATNYCQQPYVCTDCGTDAGAKCARVVALYSNAVANSQTIAAVGTIVALVSTLL